MPFSSKTLMDFFPQSNPDCKSKHLKTSSTDDGNLHSITPLSLSSEQSGCSASASSPKESSSDAPCLTAEQKSRMEFSQSLAEAKRNLRICSEKVQNSKVKGGNGYVKLEELLVENSWLEVLQGQFEKPYAKNLCKSVETEMCCCNLPICPPQHLIFNALNSTPFDKV